MKVYNPTDSPVVIDDEGRILGGRERGTVKQTKQVDAAVAARRLVKVEDKKASSTSSSSKKTAKNSDSEE